MSRFATIDLGTNTALLFIGEHREGALTTILDRAEMPRLGQGVSQRGALSDDAKARTRETLQRYADLVREAGARAIACIGTAALRDAADGPAFREELQQLIGAPVEIISGDDEARLVARAVQGAFPLAGRRVAFDVGGGSTEIVLLEGATLAARRSYQIGSVKMFERHLKDDPPTKEQLRAMRSDIEQSFQELPFEPPRLDSPAQLIGVAGTATTLCAVVRAVAPYDAAKIHGAVLTLAEVKATLDSLNALTLKERLAVPGLMPGRADVILGGAAVFLAVIQRLKAQSVTISDHGIRHGLFWERFVDPQLS